MSIEEKKKNEVEWFYNPNIVTNIIIGLIALIVILSQSFAINNNLSAMEILSSILNHNIVYLLMCVYFVALKTKVGKKYFDFLNVFIIALHSLTAITSLLTVFQSFGLSSLLTLAIDLLVLIYMFHTFLRSTRVWKSMSLGKSPFNEISNNGYFGSILVLVMTLLAVNLISTTSSDGTILAIMDAIYTILFARYIFLYGEYLNSKKISIKNVGNFDEMKEKITESVNEFVDEHKLDEKLDVVKEKLSDVTETIKDKTDDLKDSVNDKLEDLKLEEKFDSAKETIGEFTENVKDEFIDIKAKVEDKIEKVEFDEKLEEVKDFTKDFANEVKDEFIDLKKEVAEKIKESELDDMVHEVKNKITKKVSSKPKNEITSRKKNIKKNTKKSDNVKKGNK